MKIDDKHLYHGAALAQIIEHPSFTALNRENDMPKSGHYLINHNIHLFIKYSTSEGEWLFTFKPQDVQEYKKYINSDSGQKLFLCLACIPNAVGVLGKKEIERYLDMNYLEQQWIRVIEKTGDSRTTLQMTSSMNETKGKFSHANFPGILFQ